MKDSSCDGCGCFIELVLAVVLVAMIAVSVYSEWQFWTSDNFTIWEKIFINSRRG